MWVGYTGTRHAQRIVRAVSDKRVRIELLPTNNQPSGGSTYGGRFGGQTKQLGAKPLDF